MNNISISTDAEDEGRIYYQDVRGSKVIRVLGDKVNPHNRLKKYRLCGFAICLLIKKNGQGFPDFPGYSDFLKSWKTWKTRKT